MAICFVDIYDTAKCSQVQASDYFLNDKSASYEILKEHFSSWPTAFCLDNTDLWGNKKAKVRLQNI